MPKRSYKAVFFDLDGTLLPIDMDAFLKNYFNDIAAFVQARGHDPKQFIDALSAGVKSMLTKQGGLNSERFWETFTSRMGGDSSVEYEKMMDEYYATCFDGLSAMATNVDPNAAYAVKTLKEKGYPLYLTTMPLFPALRLKSAFLGRMSPQAHRSHYHVRQFHEHQTSYGLFPGKRGGNRLGTRGHPYGGKQYQRRLSGDEVGLGCLSGNRLAS